MFRVVANPEQTQVGLSSAIGSCKCGAAQNPDRPDRCLKGHTWKGYAGPAVVTASRSIVFWEQQAAYRQQVADDVIADAGIRPGDPVPRALALAADGIAQASIIRDSAFARMVEEAGPLTLHGRQRRAFLVWTAATDRVEKYLRLVGLSRRSKDIGGMSLDAYLLARST